MKKYLVIGNPIKHSLSPKLHNYWLRLNNIDAKYEKIKLEVHEIDNFIEDIKQQKITGCNVTVPFKKIIYYVFISFFTYGIKFSVISSGIFSGFPSLFTKTKCISASVINFFSSIINCFIINDVIFKDIM